VEYHASSSTERGNPMNQNDTQIYNYQQLQKELFAAMYLAVAVDNVLQEASLLPNKAEASHQVAKSLETVYQLLHAIKTNRAKRQDGSPNVELYQSFRG
jgi:hypothetical protein